MPENSEKNTWWKFSCLLVDNKWMEPAYIATDIRGIIRTIQNIPPAAPCKLVEGVAIPGFTNAHSHAFQYAMAGMAEYLSPKNPMDDFWSWREAMYDLALRVSPEEMEIIATQAYLELLKHGYTHVIEFHYLHNDIKGKPYANRAELAERLILAALRVGIRLTLVPVYYHMGDFAKPALPKQKRFLSKSPEDYFSLLEACKKSIHHANQNLASPILYGMGIHSLRAATSKDIFLILEQHEKGIPFHLHIAEQQKEVDCSLKVLGKRPLTWLLKNILPRFQNPRDLNLVHATHATNTEAKALAKSKVNLIFCPSTEGNLGDGFFPLEVFLRGKGNFTIGSDSHIGISPLEEIRWLDYVQRLRKEKRNTLCFKAKEDSGEKIFHSVIQTGKRASGISSSSAEKKYFSPGMPLDAVVLNSALLNNCSTNRRLSTITFATTPLSISKIILSGKIIVENGKHLQEEKIHEEFSAAITKLGIRK